MNPVYVHKGARLNLGLPREIVSANSLEVWT